MVDKAENKNTVAHNLAVILLYISTGYLGLMLAVPPGYATAIWSPSGIALGAVLVWGLRTLPGIFIASYLLNFYITIQNPSNSLDFTTLFTGVITGTGSLLQALFGWWLVKYFVRLNNPLHIPKDILLFALLTGPVSCVVAATVGNVGLSLLHVVSTENFALSWATWWIGDSIGVLIFTPVFLITFAKPRKLWRSRIIPVLIPLCLTFLIIIIAHVFYSLSELRRVQLKFTETTQYKVNQLNDKLKMASETARTISLYLTSKANLDNKDFQYQGGLLLKENPIIQSIQWVPKITQRDSFEKKYHAEILDKTADSYSSSRNKSVYYPILFTVAKSSDIFPQGYDLSSDPRLSNSLNSPQTSPVTINDGTSNKLLIISPVYRENQLSGFTVIQIDYYKLFNQIFNHFLNYSHITISLNSQDSQTKPLHEFYNEPNFAKTGKFNITYQQHFPGPIWDVNATVSPYFINHEYSWHVWSALTATLFFCVLMNIILFILNGQRYLIQYVARAKTMQLKTEKTKNRLLLNAANEGIFRISVDYKITFINPAAENLLGYSSDELKNESIIRILNENITDPFSERIENSLIYKAIEDRNIIKIKEAVFWKKDHSNLKVEYTCIPIIINHQVTGAAIIFSDITERVENELKLIKMAHFDPLTKLSNRLSFFDFMDHALARAKRKGTQFAVCFIDIDNFKIINDTFGHVYGDKLLMSLPGIITPHLREMDYLARIGGDEFGLIFEDVHDENDLIIIFERILLAFKTPITIDDYKIQSSISLGVALYPNHGSDTQTLFKNADIAMYRAKAKGKSTFTFFSPDDR